MILSIAVIFNSVVILYMCFSFLNRINKLKIACNEMHRDQLYAIETLNQEIKVELLHLQAIIIQMPKDHKEQAQVEQKQKTSEKRPTEKEKLALSRREAMSRRMKEWWAEDKRRAVAEAQLGAEKTKPQPVRTV